MKKDTYLKKLEFINDEIKWWMTALLWLLSGSIGFIFALIQNKITLNGFMFIFSIIYLSFIFYTNIKIKKLKEEREKILQKFQKDKRC